MIELKMFDYNMDTVLKNHGIETGGRVQKYIDSEVLRLSEQFVPKDTGELISSGIRNTKLGSGEVVYNTVYARRWYYRNTTDGGEPVHFNEAPQRGSYWFERMKQQYRQNILDGATRRL
jgi:hypothetical protein